MNGATMADYPKDLRYTKDHEWLRTEGDRWRVGITSFAVEQLGDITLVELPRVGAAVRRGEAFGSVESVKSVSDLFAPISGKISAVNGALKDSPELVNSEPYGGGWMVEIEPGDRGELDELLAADAYEQLLASGG
jgi:glycine cleavage system H protein